MIYVLGSLNMDNVVTVDKVPQAGETVMAESFSIFCGGKGANQATAIGKMGGKVAMIGCVGGDENGKIMTANLKKYNVDTSNINIVDGNSSMAFIFVEDGNNRIAVTPGANDKVTKEIIDKAFEGAKDGDILVCQLEIPVDMVAYALKIAKGKGLITILNPAPACELTADIYSNVDIITPNETETKLLTDVEPIDIVHTALAVKKFYTYGLKKAIITLGGRGSAVCEGQTITEVEAKKVKVVDTTAAGDTFVGAVAVRLSMGYDLVSACEFATCASSLTIQKQGATDSIPTLSQVEKIYNN